MRARIGGDRRGRRARWFSKCCVCYLDDHGGAGVALAGSVSGSGLKSRVC